MSTTDIKLWCYRFTVSATCGMKWRGVGELCVCVACHLYAIINIDQTNALFSVQVVISFYEIALHVVKLYVSLRAMYIVNEV